MVCWISSGLRRSLKHRANRVSRFIRIAAPAAAGPDAAEERRFIDRWPWKSDASTACSSALSTGCRAPGAVSFTIFDLLRPHIYARAAAPGPASWRRTGNGPTSAAVRCRRRGSCACPPACAARALLSFIAREYRTDRCFMSREKCKIPPRSPSRLVACAGELLPVVRSMDIDADLERAESAIPQKAYEALFLLASGYNLDQVFGEMQKPQEEPPAVDTTDYGKALRNEDSQRRFHIVEGSRELAEILTAPLEQWRIFLHPKQRQLVRMRAGGPVRVLGGAGTGKTVVAMHRARYLAEEVFTGKDDRVLFTTFR